MKKRIYLNWRSDRLPTYDDCGNQACWHEKVIYHRQGKTDWCGPRKVIRMDFWASPTEEIMKEGFMAFEYATPLECLQNKGILTAEEFKAKADEMKKILEGHRPVMTIIDDLMNEWIPGYKPEEEGDYEVTFDNGKVYFGYYDGKSWNYYTVKGLDVGICRIIAHKKIKLSEPYQEPKKERELLCPFEDPGEKKHDVEIRAMPIGKGVTGYQWSCNESSCYASGRTLMNKDIAEKSCFDLYDKLNKPEGPLELPWITDREPEHGAGYYIYSPMGKAIRQTENEHWFSFITDVRKHGWLPGDFFAVPDTVKGENDV